MYFTSFLMDTLWSLTESDVFVAAPDTSPALDGDIFQRVRDAFHMLSCILPFVISGFLHSTALFIE